MSDSLDSIGLSEEQVKELLRIKNKYQSRIGYKIADRAVWFGNHLSNYLSALCLDATIENDRPKKLRRSTQMRRYSMRAFKSYLGREPTADDLVGELSRFVAVPGFVSEAIRRDVARLLA